MPKRLVWFLNVINKAISQTGPKTDMLSHTGQSGETSVSAGNIILTLSQSVVPKAHLHWQCKDD